MSRLRQPICVASALVVPLLALGSLGWPSMGLVPPGCALVAALGAGGRSGFGGVGWSGSGAGAGWSQPWWFESGAGVAAVGLVVGPTGPACGTDSTQPESGLVGLAWFGGSWSVVDPAALAASWWSLGPPHPELGFADLVVSGLGDRLLAPVLVSLQLLLWRRRVPS